MRPDWRRWAPAGALLMLLGCVALLQWPATHGGFLFDDAPNLEALGAHGGIESERTLRAYLLGGLAGPSGRPLALLSFLVDDNAWPSAPQGFKRTNLALHLINIALLAWAALKLARFHGFEPRRASWLALGVAAGWGLHPYLISTTFYVVQRMALLSATFVLAGIAAYLHGRMLLPNRPRAGIAWMSGAIVLGALLATASKENGALLPLLLLVIEACGPAGAPPLPRWLRWGGLYLPAAAVLAYLLSFIDFSPEPWPERNFNQMERLLTQARILWEYLGHWFLPRIEGAGLFRDDIEISRSLFAPPSTAWAAVTLLALLVFAWRLRRRWPFLSLGVLFFFAGHLIESGWLGLELAFEHRNYLPTVFLFLPLAAAATAEQDTLGRRAARVAGAGLLALCAMFAQQRALLWADTTKLEVYWALAAPDSPRAANALAGHWFSAGRPDQARRVLDEALGRHPDSGLLILADLLLRQKTMTATPADYARAARRLADVPFDAQTVVNVRKFVEMLSDSTAMRDGREGMRLILAALQENPRYARFALFRRLMPYLHAKLALADGQVDAAERHYAQAIDAYGQLEAAMQMVAEMGNAGHPAHALRLLGRAEALLDRDAAAAGKFPADFFRSEIIRIRALLREELARQENTPAPARRTAGPDVARPSAMRLGAATAPGGTALPAVRTWRRPRNPFFRHRQRRPDAALQNDCNALPGLYLDRADGRRGDHRHPFGLRHSDVQGLSGSCPRR